MRPGTIASGGMPVYPSSTGERLWFSVACSFPCCCFPASWACPGVAPHMVQCGLRDVMEATDGSVWVGTTADGGRVYRHGKAADFGPNQGYPEASVFTIFEYARSEERRVGKDCRSRR